MRKIFLLALVTLLLFAQNSFAFSVDRSSNQNTDGSQKFSDPDEKMPGFMINSSGNGSNTSSQYATSNAVTMPSMQDSDSGTRAFDRAFSHQQDKE